MAGNQYTLHSALHTTGFCLGAGNQYTLHSVAQLATECSCTPLGCIDKKHCFWVLHTTAIGRKDAGKERRKSSLGHIACKELCWEGKKKEQLGAHSIQSSMYSSCNKNKAAATLDSKKKSRLKRPKA